MTRDDYMTCILLRLMVVSSIDLSGGSGLSGRSCVLLSRWRSVSASSTSELARSSDESSSGSAGSSDAGGMSGSAATSAGAGAVSALHQPDRAPRACDNAPPTAREVVATARPVLATAALTFLPPSVVDIVWANFNFISATDSCPENGCMGMRLIKDSISPLLVDINHC